MIEHRDTLTALGIRFSRRLPIADNDPWRQQAACRGADPDLFFPKQGANQTTVRHVVDSYCTACPVSKECLKEARTHDSDGIWGGMLPDERRGRFRVGAFRFIECEQCGATAKDYRQGVPRRYCSNNCVKKAHRQRKAAS